MSEFGMDSLDAVEFCMSGELKFNIEISDEDMWRMMNNDWTVGQVIEFIQNQPEKKNDENFLL